MTPRPRLHTSDAPPATLAVYVEQLRAEAHAYARRGGAELAACMESIADDLAALADAAESELLTLTDAAAVSGYSDDHLGRLVRDGKLTNYGKPHAPRVKRSELPHRPQRLRARADVASVGASKVQLARQITGAR